MGHASLLPCCQGRNTHGGPGCVWPGDRTYPLREFSRRLDRDDLTPVRVEDLPPWECCGRRGRHWPSCPNFMEEDPHG